MKSITISPITRLEGHGKVEIFLREDGSVDRAFLQIPEFRGFEKFSEGRLVEEMPRITPRICGVCPMAHHMASVKAVDQVYGVEPTPTARAIRELLYSAFMVEDHLLHFFFLGGPDFVMGPDAPAGERNILGVIAKVGMEIAGRLIDIRKRLREIMGTLGGKPVHPVFGLPGGVSRGVTLEEASRFQQIAAEAVDFCRFSLGVFDNVVLKNKQYVDLIVGDVYRHETYYMGLVDDRNRVNFYDGAIRVVDPAGKEFARFSSRAYEEHIAEHVEPWTYVRFPYLRKVGWKGFKDGAESGIYAVAPLARLNAASGMATPLAQAEHDRMFEVLGGKPSGLTLGFHWARLIEALYAAERLQELAADGTLTGTDLRRTDYRVTGEGWGVVEAPRGTLLHHYRTDDRGIVTKANLIVPRRTTWDASPSPSTRRHARSSATARRTRPCSTWWRWPSGPTTRAWPVQHTQ
jgi:F420-non-reducing hydrogenase large subunit